MQEKIIRREANFSPNPNINDIDMAFREIAKKDDRFFPIRVHYTVHRPDMYVLINKHWHEEMEILYLNKGSMEISIEEHTIIAEEKDIVVIPSNALHTSYNVHSMSCEFCAIVFNTHFIASCTRDLIQDKYIDSLTKSPPKIYWVKNSDKSYNDFFLPLNALVDYFVQEYVGYELAVKANLLNFFSAFYRNIDHIENFTIESMGDYSLNSYICKKIVLYIKENCANKICLDDVSEYMGFSKGYFCRFFKRHFKMSFFTYIAQERIKNAQYLLTHSRQKIIDIAISTGFENANYFAMVFKKETGYTPSEYRKLKLRNNFIPKA